MFVEVQGGHVTAIERSAAAFDQAIRSFLAPTPGPDGCSEPSGCDMLARRGTSRRWTIITRFRHAAILADGRSSPVARCRRSGAPAAADRLQPGARVWLHAHNCYPGKRPWGDRIERALAVRTSDIAIEQDVAWFVDPATGRGRIGRFARRQAGRQRADARGALLRSRAAARSKRRSAGQPQATPGR